MGCLIYEGQPTGEVIYPAALDLVVTEIEYLPVYGLAAVRIDHSYSHSEVDCHIYEIDDGTGALFLRAFPETPYFTAGHRHCLRAASGNGEGRSAFSNQICVDLEQISAADCPQPDVLDERNVCYLPVEEYAELGGQP